MATPTVHDFPFHSDLSTLEEFETVITGWGRFVFIGVKEEGDHGMEVWEMVASGPTFQMRQSISWREALPEYDPGPGWDFDVARMHCTEEWLAVAFQDGLVTVWGWRAGETALELLLRINYYHRPRR